MACHVEGPPDQRADAHQLNRLRTAERPTGLIVYERLVQLNLHERLQAPDLRVLHSPHIRRGVYGGAS